MAQTRKLSIEEERLISRFCITNRISNAVQLDKEQILRAIKNGFLPLIDNGISELIDKFAERYAKTKNAENYDVILEAITRKIVLTAKEKIEFCVEDKLLKKGILDSKLFYYYSLILEYSTRMLKYIALWRTSEQWQEITTKAFELFKEEFNLAHNWLAAYGLNYDITLAEDIYSSKYLMSFVGSEKFVLNENINHELEDLSVQGRRFDALIEQFLLKFTEFYESTAEKDKKLLELRQAVKKIYMNWLFSNPLRKVSYQLLLIFNLSYQGSEIISFLRSVTVLGEDLNEKNKNSFIDCLQIEKVCQDKNSFISTNITSNILLLRILKLDAVQNPTAQIYKRMLDLLLKITPVIKNEHQVRKDRLWLILFDISKFISLYYLQQAYQSNIDHGCFSKKLIKTLNTLSHNLQTINTEYKGLDENDICFVDSLNAQLKYFTASRQEVATELSETSPTIEINPDVESKEKIPLWQTKLNEASNYMRKQKYLDARGALNVASQDAKGNSEAYVQIEIAFAESMLLQIKKLLPLSSKESSPKLLKLLSRAEHKLNNVQSHLEFVSDKTLIENGLQEILLLKNDMAIKLNNRNKTQLIAEPIVASHNIKSNTGKHLVAKNNRIKEQFKLLTPTQRLSSKVEPVKSYAQAINSAASGPTCIKVVIPSALASFIKLLTDLGAIVLFVGGGPRDLILKDLPHDYDLIAVAQQPQQFWEDFFKNKNISRHYNAQFNRYVIPFENIEIDLSFTNKPINQVKSEIVEQADCFANTLYGEFPSHYNDTTKELALTDLSGQGFSDVLNKRIFKPNLLTLAFQDASRLLRWIRLSTSRNFIYPDEFRVLPYEHKIYYMMQLTNIHIGIVKSELKKLFLTGHARSNFVYLHHYGFLDAFYPNLPKMLSDAVFNEWFCGRLSEFDQNPARQNKFLFPKIYALLMIADYLLRDNKKLNLDQFLSNYSYPFSQWQVEMINEEVKHLLNDYQLFKKTTLGKLSNFSFLNQPSRVDLNGKEQAAHLSDLSARFTPNS